MYRICWIVFFTMYSIELWIPSLSYIFFVADLDIELWIPSLSYIFFVADLEEPWMEFHA